MQRLSRLSLRAVETAVVLVLISFPAVALGSSVALDDEASEYSVVSETVTIGHPFEVTEYFRVTGLGVFDHGYDGLGTSHKVAIWTEEGLTVVAPTTVTGNQTSPSKSSLGEFVVVSIPHVVLSPGSYIIAGFFEAHSDNGLAYGPYATAPGVSRTSDKTYVQASSDLIFPTDYEISERTFVTFTGGLLYVPEPSLLALASFGLLFILRRRAR